MTVDRFVDQLIQNEDEFMAKLFPDTDLMQDMAQSKEEALEAAEAALWEPESGWSRGKLNKMDDEDVIAAEPETFYETYGMLLKDRLVNADVFYKYGEDENAKESFITFTFESREL